MTSFKIRNSAVHLICAFAAITMLSGCSYFDAPEPETQKIDLMAEQALEQERQPIQDIDFMTAANNASGSNVEVFSFDQPSAQGSILSPTAGGSARSSMSNPSVEVFPLDGAPAPRPAVVAPAPAPAVSAPVPAVPVAPVQIERGGQVDGSAVMAPAANADARIYFAHGSSNLSARDNSVISGVAGAHNGGVVKVSAFSSARSRITDPIKRKVANLKMSMDRAFAVSKRLIMGGVPAERIETAAYGEMHNTQAMDGLSVEAASRRVDIAAR